MLANVSILLEVMPQGLMVHAFETSFFTHLKKKTWSLLNTLRPSLVHLPDFVLVMT